MTVEVFAGSVVVESDLRAALNGLPALTLLVKRGMNSPITISIISIRYSCDGLLAAATTILYFMRMEPDTHLQVLKLDNTGTRDQLCGFDSQNEG